MLNVSNLLNPHSHARHLHSAFRTLLPPVGLPPSPFSGRGHPPPSTLHPRSARAPCPLSAFCAVGGAKWGEGRGEVPRFIIHHSSFYLHHLPPIRHSSFPFH